MQYRIFILTSKLNYIIFFSKKAILRLSNRSSRFNENFAQNLLFIQVLQHRQEWWAVRLPYFNNRTLWSFAGVYAPIVRRNAILRFLITLWSLVPASHTLLGPSLLTIETILSNSRNTSQNSRDPHARRDMPDWWIDKMATDSSPLVFVRSSTPSPAKPPNISRIIGRMNFSEWILAYCPRMRRDIAWWLIFRRDERPRGMITFAGGTTVLAIERRLRDNHVMRRQARGAPGTCRDIYPSDLWDIYYLKQSYTT